jgi:hypothetical protein
MTTGAGTTGIRVNSTHVVSDVFDDGEAAVIDLRSGAYFSLNPTGALLWPMIVAGTTSDHLVTHIRAVANVGAEVAADVDAFVGALVAEDLVEHVDDVNGNGAHAANGTRVPYSPPTLERFDDLQELLLLDPIHDVSDEGWPHAQSG